MAMPSVTICDAARAPAWRPSRGGFTLLEVMIAISILGIGSVVLLTTIISITEMSTRNREEALANRAMQAKAEEIRAAASNRGYDWMICNYQVLEPSFTIEDLRPTEADATDDPDLLGGRDVPMSCVCQITVYLNEQDVPPEAGANEERKLDLNGDGDTTDDFTAPLSFDPNAGDPASTAEYGNNLVAVELTANWRTGRSDARAEATLSRYLLVGRSR